MFNDLAGKFLSIVSVKVQEDDVSDLETGRLARISATIDDDGRQSRDVEVKTASISDNDDDDFGDEWVLLDDDDEEEADNDGSSISDDVDLLLSTGGDDDSTTTTTNTGVDVLSPTGSAGSGADSSMHQSSWQLTPPPCFTASTPLMGRGRNKYKHAKHRNANLAVKSSSGQQRLAGSSAASRADDVSEFSIVGNLLIEHPDPAGLRLYERQVLGLRQCGAAAAAAAVSADKNAIEDFNSMNPGVENDNLVSDGGAGAGDKENVDGAAVSVVGSVTTPVYVVIGENVCAKPMSRRPVSSGCRLEINPQLQERAASSSGSGSVGRRAKRQHFTVYDPCVFGANKLGAGARGRQRKDRVSKNLATLATGRPNDRKGQ